MAKQTNTMWTYIRRSPYQALAASLIMGITFLMLSVFTFLSVGSQLLISYFESKPEVTVFFNNDAKQADMDVLRTQLSSSGKVSKVKFISRDQALSIYKEQNKNDPLLLELVTADILPASLEVSTYNVGDLSQIAQTVQSSPVVSQVVFQKDVVSTLSAWTNSIRQVGIAVVSLLILESLLVMMIIIGIKISQRRHEIEVMQLIGATKSYISSPFVLEGITYAVIGALFGSVLGSAAVWYYTNTLWVSKFFAGVPFLPVPWTFYIIVIGLNLFIAVLLGFIASILAVNRYLKD